MSCSRYAALIPTRRRAEIKDWCFDAFGPSAGISKDSRWFMLDYTVQFRYEKDRNWFLLRWGEQ